MDLKSVQNKLILRKLDEKLFLVFGTEVANITTFSGKSREVVLNCLNIDSCIANKDFMAECLIFKNEDEIDQEFDLLESADDLQLFIPTLFSSLAILTSYLKRLKNDFEICTNAFQSFKSAISNIDSSKDIPDNSLLVVSLKDHKGNSVDLDEKEKDRIYDIIVKSIQENVDINTDSEMKMQKLQDEIEIEVIKVLPDHYNDTNIKINLELIKKHIEELRDN